MGASSMGAEQSIRSLFASDIGRNIEEVIKVDQRDEEIIRDEINEYVVTDSILKRYTAVLERYAETPNLPHEGVGVWVSGFYGSGKSSFANRVNPQDAVRPSLFEGRKRVPILAQESS